MHFEITSQSGILVQVEDQKLRQLLERLQSVVILLLHTMNCVNKKDAFNIKHAQKSPSGYKHLQVLRSS